MTGLKSLLGVNAIACCMLIVFLLALSGCAPKQTLKNSSHEDVLRERVMAYWNFRIKGEYDKSYAFEDPFFRKKVGLVDYIQHSGRAVRTKSVSIEGLKIGDDNAEVELSSTIKVNVPDPAIMRADLPQRLTDRWVSVEGVWYHVQPERGLRKR